MPCGELLCERCGVADALPRGIILRSCIHCCGAMPCRFLLPVDGDNCPATVPMRMRVDGNVRPGLVHGECFRDDDGFYD